MWVLFPPQDYPKMYPTRVPYEETSIFSQIDIIVPNLTKFPLFSGAISYVVTLNEGDALFIPKHWWHYVESLNNSISLNCWFDSVIRLHSF